MSTIARKSSTVWSRSRASTCTAALFTITSIRPAVPSTDATISPTRASSPTSPTNQPTGPADPRMASAVARVRSGSRPTMNTRAPSAA